jgi:hypothetical protein
MAAFKAGSASSRSALASSAMACVSTCVTEHERRDSDKAHRLDMTS